MKSIQFWNDVLNNHFKYFFQDGYTPLLLAVTENKEEMVEFLLKKGADVNASDKNQRYNQYISVR